MRLLLAAALVAGSLHGVRADDTFESRGGQRIKNLAELAWALTATCETGDDVQQRQCRVVRDARQKQLAGATLLVDAQPAAFEVGAWSPAKKSIALSLSACIDCGGVAVGGKTYFLTGANAQPVADGARVKTAARLLDTTRTFPDEATAKAWLKVVGAARVQLLVKVPDKAARWQAGGKEGLALDIVGYRVYGACEGTVIVASPPSGNVELDKSDERRTRSSAGGGAKVDDKTACAKADGSADFQMEGEPGELTSRQVNDALAPVVAAARGCFARYKIAGTAKLELTIAADGSVAKYAQAGDYQNTPTGRCIDDAMRKVRFPKATARATIVYPIPLK